jgi:putative tryptophan/tyrosine transport system substrate-binding protein
VAPESFNRPGGNLTGVSLLNDELVAKRLELLRELVPKAATIATLVNPDNRNHPSHARTLEAVARAGGQQVIVIGATVDADLEPAFAMLVQRRADALVVNADPFFDSRQEQIVGLATRHAVPTIFPWREFVQVGGLASYGTSLLDAHRQTGVYAGRILKGL